MTPTRPACSPAIAGGAAYRANNLALTFGPNRTVGRTQNSKSQSHAAHNLGPAGQRGTGSATALCRTDGWLAAQPDWRVHALEARAFLGLSLCGGLSSGVGLDWRHAHPS
jgi:hypothetical protein